MAVLLGATTPGCSLLLDFSEIPDAAPEPNPNCDLSEPNDSLAEAITIPAGTTTAALCGADIDFYEIVIGSRDDLEITTTGTAPLDLELQLLENGEVVDTSDGPGSGEAISRTDALGNRLGAGSYNLRIAAGSQAAEGEGEGDYSVTITITTGSFLDAGVPDAM